MPEPWKPGDRVIVPDIPEEAVTRAAEAITLAANHFEAGETESSAVRFARAALEAAAPVLAGAWGVRLPRPESPSALARKAHRAVACPSCGAGQGELCVTTGRRNPATRIGYTLSYSHAARRRLAAGYLAGPESRAGDDEEAPGD